MENFNLDGIDVAALPAQQKHAKEPDQSVLQQVWEEHVALVMDQVCRMSPEYLDLEQETRLDILLLEQARAENNLQAMLGLEILHVAPHVKRGHFVCAHLHLNATYLLEADDQAPIRCKPDENSAVRWLDTAEVLAAISEPAMLPVYRKLMEKAAR